MVVYPTTRFALRRSGALAERRARTPVYAVCAICCVGELAVLWALGAPPAAMLLALCGLLGALIGLPLNHCWRKVSVDVALTVFFGGAALACSWLGLGVLALAAWLSRARVASGAHTRAERVTAWVLGLGLAWGVYLPLLSLWEFVGFWWGFTHWLGA